MQRGRQITHANIPVKENDSRQSAKTQVAPVGLDEERIPVERGDQILFAEAEQEIVVQVHFFR